MREFQCQGLRGSRMAAFQIWRMQGLTWNPTHTHNHFLRTNVQSPCCLFLFLFPYLKLYCFSSPFSLLSSSSFPHTQPHYGGSFMLDHDPCPVCPLTHTHTYTLVVSSGPVRGCSVYCGEDVRSCKPKSLTSLILTGAFYTIFTDWSMLDQIVCRHVAAEGSVRGWYQANVSNIELHVCALIWHRGSPFALPFSLCLGCFSFSHCDFTLDLESLQTVSFSN